MTKTTESTHAVQHYLLVSTGMKIHAIDGNNLGVVPGGSCVRVSEQHKCIPTSMHSLHAHTFSPGGNPQANVGIFRQSFRDAFQESVTIHWKSHNMTKHHDSDNDGIVGIFGIARTFPNGAKGLLHGIEKQAIGRSYSSVKMSPE